MKIFRTASLALVTECQRSFCFLPVTSQIVIRTAKFLQVFLGTDNILCEYNVRTAGQLASRIYDVFIVVE